MVTLKSEEITLSEEYFHSSTLSMLFLLVNLGLAPTKKKINTYVNKHNYITLKQKIITSVEALKQFSLKSDQACKALFVSSLQQPDMSALVP